MISKTAGITFSFSNWHEKANEENKLEWKNRINQKVGRTAQETERDDQTKENKKTDELRNLISEVVKFSVKICSKIRQFSFSL